MPEQGSRAAALVVRAETSPVGYVASPSDLFR